MSSFDSTQEPGREELMANLRAMTSGEGTGLEIDSPMQWVVDGIKEPIPFFRSLSLLIPPSSVLYMEGCEIRPWAVDLYERHAATSIVPVARDTIAPTPEMFHVAYSVELIEELCEMAKGRSSHELFYHIKGYSGQKLLFTFHDAFDGDLRISGDIGEPVIAAFCESLGATFGQEQTKKRDIKKTMSAFLDHLERGTLEPAPKPFWKRVWNRLFRN